MDNKGLSPEEYLELLQYISKNNGWSNLSKVLENKRPLIKYVSCSYDTRDNSIWSITLKEVDEVNFRTERGYNLKEKVYNYLDYGLKNKEEN